MADNKDKDIRRFAGVQRIIFFSIMILALVVVAVNFLPLAGEDQPSGVSILEPAVDVRNEDSSLFGNVQIIVTDGWSLEYACVLVNGVPTTNFAKGEALVRVYPGDVISIDGSAYKRKIDFQIEAISSNIDKSYVSQKITTDGSIVDMGIIVFK